MYSLLKNDNSGRFELIKEQTNWENQFETWELFEESLIYSVYFGEGIICVVNDPVNKEVCWLYGANLKRFLSVEKFKGFLLLLSSIGVKYLGVNTEQYPKLNKVYEWAGMQKIDENLYSIRLN